MILTPLLASVLIAAVLATAAECAGVLPRAEGTIDSSAAIDTDTTRSLDPATTTWEKWRIDHSVRG